jgi:diguanylate cyclase (GGDEF)-like protein
MITYLTLLVVLTFALFLWLKRFLPEGLVKKNSESKRIKHEVETALEENSQSKQENAVLEKTIQETMALYDITKEICKYLDTEKVFGSFKENINKYIEIGDCKFLKSDADLSPYSNYTVMPLSIEANPIGYLVECQVKEQDKDKFSILAQQFLLGLKRAFLYQRIQELAIMDTLTQALSRRYCLERIHEELERSKKFDYKCSFLMSDIDHFKDINDRYGHLVGDAILREVSKVIKENIRQIDLIGRYGGEEFLIILTETDKEQAIAAAERIRESIEEKHIKVYDEELKVTISMGISVFPDEASDVQTLIEKADSALYQAKQEGRNRVCIYKSRR